MKTQILNVVKKKNQTVIFSPVSESPSSWVTAEPVSSTLKVPISCWAQDHPSAPPPPFTSHGAARTHLGEGLSCTPSPALPPVLFEHTHFLERLFVHSSSLQEFVNSTRTGTLFYTPLYPQCSVKFLVLRK